MTSRKNVTETTNPPAAFWTVPSPVPVECGRGGVGKSTPILLGATTSLGAAPVPQQPMPAGGRRPEGAPGTPANSAPSVRDGFLHHAPRQPKY